MSRPNNIQHANNNNLTGGGVDYNSGPYYVTCPAGVTRVAFYIPIINDIIHEGNESFTLDVVKNLLPSRVSCGNHCVAAVTIVDTSGEYFIVIIIIKTHSSQWLGQEEAACMCVFWSTQPLQWVIYTDGSSKIWKCCNLATIAV